MRELGHDLISLEEARETMLSLIGVIDTEPCATTEAFARVLRQAVEARDLIPPFDNSAMDGYAVRAGDLVAAAEENPVTLPVAFRLQAGDAATEALEPGSAARIMTGTPLPPGAEAVVPHELTSFTDTEVTFSAPIEAGRNVRLAGGDMKPGDVPLGPGAVLGPSQLGIAATLGYVGLEVSRRPRVAIISPGDELVDIGDEPGPGKIRNSTACSLRAAVLDRFDLSLGVGLAKLAGTVFRIGHLGDLNDLSLLGTLAGIEMGLALTAIPAQSGGVAAAMHYLQGCAREP